MFRDFVFGIIDLINLVVPVFAGIAVVLFMIGLVRYMFNAENAEYRSRNNQMITWGLVALFLLFSIWGILRVLDNSFFGYAGSPSGGDSLGEPIDIRPAL